MSKENNGVLTPNPSPSVPVNPGNHQSGKSLPEQVWKSPAQVATDNILGKWFGRKK